MEIINSDLFLQEDGDEGEVQITPFACGEPLSPINTCFGGPGTIKPLPGCDTLIRW